jgi:hypothetical protein
MKSNYWAVLSVVLVLTMASTPVFAGSRGTSDVTWKIDRYSLLATSDLKTGHHAESSIYNTYDDVKSFTHISDPAVDFENNTLLATTDSSLRAAETIAEEKEGEMTAAQIGELMANPFSYLWFGMIQNDTYWWDGDLLDFLDEDKKVMNTTLIQPVMSMQLTEKWKMIFRPVFPIQSFETISGFDIITDDQEEIIGGTADFDRKTGLGDILLWTAFTKNYRPPLVYGFGPTIMMDTASSKWLGTGKWSAGPMGLAAYITDKWIFASVAQHWWDFAGDNDRDSVNLTDFQPIIRYRLSPQTNIGIAPNIQYNWNGGSGDKLRLPIGGGISTVVMLGPLPVGIGVEYYYMVETPDTFGPEHQLRVFFTPVLPSPAWSRVPLFGH